MKSFTGRILGFVLTAAIGALGGLVPTLLLSRNAESSKVSSTTPNEPEGHPKDQSNSTVTHVWRLPESSSTAQKVDAPDSEREIPYPDDEAIRESVIAEHQRDIDNHYNDPRDARWASRAEESVRAVLDATEGTHSVLGVECKTTSCVVQLEWPSRADALNEFKKLLNASYEPNCGTKILFNEDPTEGPIREQLILDCTDARAGGS